ncbi:hypothetical protein Nmel_015153 [Mimus melanotis]
MLYGTMFAWLQCLRQYFPAHGLAMLGFTLRCARVSCGKSPCCHPGRHQVMPPSCIVSHMLPLLCMSRGTPGVLGSQNPVCWSQVLAHTV